MMSPPPATIDSSSSTFHVHGLPSRVVQPSVFSPSNRTVAPIGAPMGGVLDPIVGELAVVVAVVGKVAAERVAADSCARATSTASSNHVAAAARQPAERAKRRRIIKWLLVLPSGRNNVEPPPAHTPALRESVPGLAGEANARGGTWKVKRCTNDNMPGRERGFDR